MEDKQKKKDRLLFTLFFLAVVVSLWATYDRYIIRKDFEVVYPVEESTEVEEHAQ